MGVNAIDSSEGADELGDVGIVIHARLNDLSCCKVRRRFEAECIQDETAKTHVAEY